MQCPTDNSELVRGPYEAGIDVDQCPQCHGMWLDAQELEKIQETVERDYEEEIARLPNTVDRAYAMALERARPIIRCPRCAREMERREHANCSQVLIDVCPACRGVWLDKDEWQALEVFFERVRFETAAARRGFFSTLSRMFR